MAEQSFVEKFALWSGKSPEAAKTYDLMSLAGQLASYAQVYGRELLVRDRPEIVPLMQSASDEELAYLCGYGNASLLRICGIDVDRLPAVVI